ncbi:MAG TPA: FAD-dependent oxidoreductase [Kofleriaceae bacterium]
MRVAIVGSGIAGLASAYALAGAAEIVMYEAASRPGGHVYTVDTDGHAIDMGFIVCNRERYPQFCALLADLGIATRPTTMSFSVVHDGLEWGSESLGALFAQRRRLIDPRHWRLLAQVVGLLRRAERDLDSELVRHASLDDYLVMRGASAELRERFVVPLAAALWSLAPAECGAFPAITYLRFLDQHGMLSPIRPLRWHTIDGGSRRYVDALLARLQRRPFTLRLSTPVSRIDRDGGGVTIHTCDGSERFSRVIVATHADIALRLLAQPTDAERRALGAFRYSRNRTVLHTDAAFLPRARAAHAAWNYVADRDPSRVAVTYSMTRLQGLPLAPNGSPYLVTLNPRREPRGIRHEVEFMHPQFDRASLAAQAELPIISGTQRTYYAGAHFGFGFHEDGMRAGLAAAARVLADAAVREQVAS